jgi:hypothetical protein
MWKPIFLTGEPRCTDDDEEDGAVPCRGDRSGVLEGLRSIMFLRIIGDKPSSASLEFEEIVDAIGLVGICMTAP